MRLTPLMRLLCAGLLLFLLVGCATVVQRDPVPELSVDSARLPGFPDDVRFWGDVVPPNAPEIMRESLAKRKAAGLLHDASGRLITSYSLALSGGGAEGAFGAGLLKGWSTAGTRPSFDTVTGISTGALIAPFAFLGPEYDDELETLFTTTHTRDIFRLRSLLSILGQDSFSDTAPLRQLLETHINVRFLERVAAEHAKGRTLWIGTTNLDAQRPVVWDMGKIAASGRSDAPELFRSIMLASAAIGGVFPPVYMQVEVAGEVYDEMHVDGGTANQVFLYPAALDIAAMAADIGVVRNRRAYIVRNARLAPQWQAVPPRLARIAGRSISTLIRTQGLGDIYRIYSSASRDGIDFNLAYITPDFTAEPDTEFDPAYMRVLFDYAYAEAKGGYPWVKTPHELGPSSNN
jgi:predicted acylesterase/phospholipase RssA